MEQTKGRTYFLLILLAGVSVLAFLVFKPFLVTVALSAVFAVILYPLYEKVLARLPSKKGTSAFITLVIGTFCVLLPLALIGTLVVSESRSAYISLATGSTGLTVQAVTHSVGVWLEPYVPGATDLAASISLELNSYLEQGLQWLLHNAGGALASLVSVFLRLLIFYMTLYYFLKEGVSIKNMIARQSPIADEEAIAIFTQLSRTISGIVKGSLTIACIQGALSGIGYFIFGIPNASLWGVTTAVSALIPGVGTSLVLIPAIIYLIVVGNVGSAVGLLLWAVLLVGLIDNFLSPKLMSRGAQLHPLLILLSVLGGISFFGPVGVFMGPLTVSLLFALYTTYAGHTITT
jgi:predicted PurR-regulated permease PerM